MNADRRYLLILSCSKRKRPDPGLLPAIERYDGVNFRVLRKVIREKPLSCLDVLVISAKYGLLEADTPIEDYNEKLTKRRALELVSEVSQRLDQYLSAGYLEVYVNLGQLYWITLSKSRLLSKMTVLSAYGSIGLRMSQMRSWLRKVSREERAKYERVRD